jgi:hypothetical protein
MDPEWPINAASYLPIVIGCGRRGGARNTRKALQIERILPLVQKAALAQPLCSPKANSDGPRYTAPPPPAPLPSSQHSQPMLTTPFPRLCNK